MVKSTDTRSRILAVAKQIFLSRGYTGTSVDMICEQAKVSKGSFYHFYPSKEELGLSVLTWSLEQGGEILGSGPFSALKDPVARSLGYLQHVEANSILLWKEGCLLGTFANELGKTQPRLQEGVVGAFNIVAGEVASRLAALAELLPAEIDAAELADQFLIILEGSITLAKAYNDPDRIPRAIRNFRESLEAQMSRVSAAAA